MIDPSVPCTSTVVRKYGVVKLSCSCAISPEAKRNWITAASSTPGAARPPF